MYIMILRQYTEGRKCMLEEAGGEQRNITEAAPNKVKLGEGGKSDESWPWARRWRRSVLVRED